MPIATVNGIRLSYGEHGAGELVVLLMGTGSRGQVWELHQVPALVEAGYRAVTIDNRGIAPSAECPDGFTIDDMAADAAELIVHLGGGPAHVVGTSLGARIGQELALVRPELVASLVLMAAHGRPEPVQDALTAGECALHDQGVVLPPGYYAAVTALQNLSPRTLGDPGAVRDWLDVLAMSGAEVTGGVRAQYSLRLEGFPDRLEAYRGIQAPTLVIGFADDLMIPPALGKEVADAVPGARYVELAGCGHFGYLERPREVNALLLDFLAEHRRRDGG